ncbi:MAG: S-methyl-5'-thioadenosine phosphorylase [Syntrophothermus sp.]
MTKIGVIGGSGLENLDIFTSREELNIRTFYGSPSSSVYKGVLENAEIFIISRHGRDHTITPSHVNNRANIMALKTLGCNYLIATTACGSLNEAIGRGHIVIPDQFIDFTRSRINTFHETFEPGVLGHVGMAEPFSAKLREMLHTIAAGKGFPVHPKGTVVTIEGPRFSTRAESKMFRMLGADIINMSTAPEAALAKEAGLEYAAIALSTDYDSWKEDEAPVSWEDVLKVFQENVRHVTEVLVEVIRTIK